MNEFAAFFFTHYIALILTLRTKINSIFTTKKNPTDPNNCLLLVLLDSVKALYGLVLAGFDVLFGTLEHRFNLNVGWIHSYRK